MVGQLYAFDQQVIDVRLHVAADLVPEDFVHQALVGGTSVLQPEWHDPIAIQAMFGDEGGVFFIFRSHTNLVVAGEGVHEAEQLVSRCCIDESVDLWQREAVFGTGFIEVGEVNADPPLTIGLLHYYNIRSPLGIMGFPNELSIEELVYLFIDGALTLGGEAPLLLLDWSKGRIDV